MVEEDPTVIGRWNEIRWVILIDPVHNGIRKFSNDRPVIVPVRFYAGWGSCIRSRRAADVVPTVVSEEFSVVADVLSMTVELPIEEMASDPSGSCF